MRSREQIVLTAVEIHFVKYREKYFIIISSDSHEPWALGVCFMCVWLEGFSATFKEISVIVHAPV